MRRGADQAVISDISFDPTGEYVACASDKGTVHLFHMTQKDNNAKSSLAGLSGIIGYFGSSWSACQMKVNDTYSKCAIMNGKLFAISTEGNYFMGNIQDGANKIEIDSTYDLLSESRKQDDQEEGA